ncbi:MDR family MFS transporter [Alicyclobacillus ferrooxydans]|uniref:MFS transporter n=1 Tax=Alicyclobacillus ferrooxydans TaxID=471514 RepID=A0A0P9CAY2_9BACL|nr:MDR family MFS transporter [Alicyclobacillus ferrooxydans]KPV42588.1 MFS transporter [Alicyclobacillus ferrooxydans]
MGVVKNQTGFIIVGLLLGILISSMDNTIVATAMGTIVAQLGGLNKFAWVSSAYMVTEMAGMPIFGKLSDMYGRKRFFILGMVLFFTGSILCGTSQNITELIIYRAVQGIGGGALAPIAFTILFDVVSPEQRGKMGGMFGAVFGLSSIFGPLLGAYITDHINWRWVFYINIPLGIVCFLLVFIFYKESMQHSKERIDWFGVLTLVPAIGSLMFALQLGGAKYPWNSSTIIGLFFAAGVLFTLFLVIEAKVKEPIVPYQMFANRLFTGSSLVALFSGGSYVVAVLFIPIFIQGVMGGTATNSGLILLPMMLASVVASQVGILIARKLTYRGIMMIFCVIFTAGIYLLSTIGVETTRLQITLFMIVIGFGIGASFSVLSVAAMQPFGMRQRGTASSTTNFIREFAMAVGITVYGIIQKNMFAHNVTQAFASQGTLSAMASKFSHTDPHAILSPQLRSAIPTPILEKLTGALSASIAHTVLWTLVPAGLALILVFVIPKEKMTMGFGELEQLSSSPSQGE